MMSWFAMSTSSSDEVVDDASDDDSTTVGLRHGTHVMTKLLQLPFEKLSTACGDLASDCRRGPGVTLEDAVPFI